MNHAQQASLRGADTFDYVIVGSGAAGSVLANRLSAGDASVCVLEAGPPDRSPFLHIPAGFIKAVFNEKYAWQFLSEPAGQTAGRRIPIPQGRTLGGSTSINGLVYNRGQAADYDRWASLGNTGWSYADVLPYFKSMERRMGGEDGYRGRDGELPVTDLDWIHPLCEAFIAGAVEMGIPRNPDYNGAQQAGVGYFQRTIERGWRMSTARCFLKPAMARRNLTVRTHAQATRVLFEDGRAAGVAYCDPRNPAVARTVLARREVIVSAGAINTPKLLQLSGLGPAQRLRELGIEVVRDLPGVGENLSDHYSVRIVARVRNAHTINELAKGVRLAGQVARWLAHRPSILALSPSVLHYFWKSAPELDAPDLQGVFTPASYKDGYVGMLDDFPGMTAGVWQHRPESRGQVRLGSPDPLAAPVIAANYLAHPGDRQTLVRGMRLARRLLRSRPLAPYFEAEILPGPACESDGELLDFARRYGVSSYHVNGTARMGPAEDPMAVVDPRLRVYGVRGLRVVDSSVMPTMPSANICAASMMIGNKAADLIRQS